MKQKYYILGLIVILSLIFVIALSPVVEKGNPSKMSNSDKSTSQTYTLRLGHNMSEQSTLHKSIQLYTQRVNERTNGKVNIIIHPNQELGNDHQMVEMARKGDLDIVLTPTAKLSVALPAVQYADLPFYFPTKDDLYTLLDGEVGQILLDKLVDIDLVGVTFWENGFKHFTANHPLEKLEDFKDKKFRIMKSRLIKDQFNALESTTLPIDFYATKKALANKVVDGQENPLIAIVSMEFYKHQSNLTISNHAYLGYVFSISSKIFEKLPSNIQEVLITTAKELTAYEREEAHKVEDLLIQKIKDANVNVHILEGKEKERIADKMKNISKKYEEIIGSDVISKTEEYLINKYKNSDEYVIIGIDADLSMGAKVSGLAIKRGAELAIEEINKTGGLLGKKVLLVAKDHSARAHKSLKNLEDFENKKNLIAIVGGLHSAIIAEGLEKIKASKIPYMIPWAAAPILTEDTNSNIFRVSANDKYASQFILDSALKASSKPAILVENSIWGRSSLNIMKKALEKRGLEFAYAKEFNRGQKDFIKEIENISKTKATSVIMVANPIEGGKILEAVANMETPLDVFSHWGIVGGNFYEKQKSNLEKVDLKFIQSFSFINNSKQNAKKLANSYIEKYSVDSEESIKAPAGVAQAYDAVYLLSKAIKQANSFEKEKIKQELENIQSFNGVIKSYKNPFSQQNHDALEKKDFFMAKFNENGLIIKEK